MPDGIEDGANIVIIKSPMVGTYYSKPNPKSEPFVKIGDHIEANTTICVIEAMKVFSEIFAEASGTVVEILAKSADLVQREQILLTLRPDSA